jgi:hypothetical protein
MSIYDIFKFLFMAVLAISVLMIVYAGFVYATSSTFDEKEGKMKTEKAKSQIVFSGFGMMICMFGFIILKTFGVATVPIEKAEIKVKDTMIVEHARSRGGSYYTCEVTDSTTNHDFTYRLNTKVEAKSYCSTYKTNKTYSIHYKHFDGEYQIMEK